ncbi:MAG: TrmH family RNA methyltransferase [Gammaproteobacteria bacterium]|nr:TrmH family RNA methyltransferase [Gammaproteobacteria bacterium]
MKQSTICIGLVNPKSPENVGSAMRASGNYGVDSVFYTGSRYPRAVALNPDTPKMSRSVSQGVPLTGVDCLLDHVPEGMPVVCVEFALNATPLPEYEHPDSAFYIFGPEDGTISQDLIDRADAVVYVPTKGCMNLSASVNVLLYDRMFKSFQGVEGNELIIENRDRNNNIKFRHSG